MTLPACTIASNNYLALASVLADSYLEHHPGARVYLCLVDEPSDSIDYAALPFEAVVPARDLDLPAPENFVFRYDQLELNTAVKPFFLEHLRDREGLDRVLYFDPDILILDRLDALTEALGRSVCLLTPHLTAPLDNVYNPSEIKIRQVGVYNLGFLGLRLDDTTRDFIAWWRDRLAQYCLAAPRDGIFVDQSWMDFAPAFLDDVTILRDPIYNVAYWNLPHRRLDHDGEAWGIEGRKVAFFHFSGMDLGDLTPLSKHQDRLDLESRSELRPLCELYRDRVIARGHDDLSGERYAWRDFRPSDLEIPPLARRLLARVDPRGRRFADPFDAAAQDGFFAFLTEAIEFEGGPLNRLVLAIWEESTWLHHTMPDVTDRDRDPFVRWLDSEGQRLFDVDPVLWEHLERSGTPEIDRALDALGSRGRWPLRAPAFELPILDGAQALLDQVDLTSPGAARFWLNEAVDFDPTSSDPVLTRLAMLLHTCRRDLQEIFPDPLERDRLAFAYWLCTDGRTEFSLHPDLVAPVQRTLPLRSRLRMKLR